MVRANERLLRPLYLGVLARDFSPRRRHAAPLRRRLEAAPVRGVYRSRTMPSLVVAEQGERRQGRRAQRRGWDVAGVAAGVRRSTPTRWSSPTRCSGRPPVLFDRRGVVAVGGTIRATTAREVRRPGAAPVVRRGDRPPALQAVEYLRAFLRGGRLEPARAATS